MVTGELSAQGVTNKENALFWWRHHDTASKTVAEYVIISQDLPLM